MAIAPGIPGLEVTIEVDNTALPEYEYDGKTLADLVVKYLEEPSGAEFSVRWLLKEPFDASIPTHADVMLDGTYLQAPFMEPGDEDGDRGYRYSKSTFTEGDQSYTQNMRFAELEFDDEHQNASKDLKRELEGIGTIIVYLYHVFCKIEVQAPYVRQLSLSQLDPMNEKINQKCAPALEDVLTHQASLAAPQAMYSSIYHSIEAEEAPFASYTFHYRSTRALKSLGVIPRTPSSSPSRSPTLAPRPEVAMRNPDTMSREELIAALNELKEREEASIHIKREQKDDDATDEGGEGGDEVVWTGTRPAKRRAFVVLDE